MFFLLNSISNKKIISLVIFLIFVLYIFLFKKIKNGQEKIETFKTKAFELKQQRNLLSIENKNMLLQTKTIENNDVVIPPQNRITNEEELILLPPYSNNRKLNENNNKLLCYNEKILLDNKFFIIKINGEQVPSIFLRDKIRDIFASKNIENVFFDESEIYQRTNIIMVSIDIYPLDKEKQNYENILNSFILKNYDSFLREDFYDNKIKKYKFGEECEFIIKILSSL